MEIERGGCDNNLWQTRPRAVRYRAQCLGAGRRQVGCLAQKATAIGWGPAAEVDRLRSIGQALKPILPVTREALRCAIGCVLLQERGERAERIGTARQFIYKRGVNIRHPSLEQRAAKAVHQNMVETLIPKEPIRR